MGCSQGRPPLARREPVAAPIESLSSEQVDARLVEYRKGVWATQAHVFSAFEAGRLNADQKRQLLADVRAVDPKYVSEIWARTQAESKAPSSKIAPFPQKDLTIKKDTNVDTRKLWYKHGLGFIAAGKVAIVLMAGGQGSRLGSSAPKGCFDIGLLSGKSLFQLQADRIQALKRQAYEATPPPARAGCAMSAQQLAPLPWYIMTSEATGEATKAYFEKHNYFDLPHEDVIFFEQGVLPALRADGSIIMQSPSKIALSPNGNGGLYAGLAQSGCLENMQARGIEHVHVYGVDNVLAVPGDPSFLGFASFTSSECSNKVIIRTDAKEKVGAMCLRDGLPSVVEYSEVVASAGHLADGRDSKGNLLLNAANIANHYFTLPFLIRLATQPLPFHLAKKGIPVVDEKEEKKEIEGFKLEMFVFDSFPFSRNVTAFAVDRADEFSPVKNKGNIDIAGLRAYVPPVLDAAEVAALSASPSSSSSRATARASAAALATQVLVPDSPDTARRDITALHIRWAERAGFSFTADDKRAGYLFELSASSVCAGEMGRVGTALGLIRIPPEGMQHHVV